jgi:hypothetical protein
MRTTAAVEARTSVGDVTTSAREFRWTFAITVS